jgi:adenylate cyclase
LDSFNFFKEFRKRQLWKIIIAYPAAAFLILQAVEFFMSNYGWNPKFLTFSLILMGGGLPIAMINNWFHGEKGVQKFERAEISYYVNLSIMTFAFAIMFWFYGGENGNKINPEEAISLAIIDTSPEKSIAVLPFQDISEGQDQAYFSDGIAEEILNKLSKIRGLKVPGRTSSFSFRDQETTHAEIASVLNVRTILDGSVRRFEDRVRINVQVINAADGFQIWSEQFDREFKDIFALQDEIARTIATKLSIELEHDQIDEISKPLTSNMEAYDLYLQALAQGQSPPEGLEEGTRLAKQAILLDPEFQFAYSALANFSMGKAWWGTGDTKEAFGESRVLAEKFSEVNESFALGYLKLFGDWEWERGRNVAEQLVVNYPDNAESYMVLSTYYRLVGHHVVAIELINKGIDLDPYSIVRYFNKVRNLNSLKRFDEAMDVAKKMIEISPNSSIGYRVLGICYRNLGQFDQSLEAFDTEKELSNNVGWGVNDRMVTLAMMGNTEEVYDYIEEVKNGNYSFDTNTALAQVYVGLNDYDKAIDYLEKGHEKGEFWSSVLKTYELWDPMREMPRFQGLLEKMNYPKISQLDILN